jgi:hypothetical protein
MEQRVTTYSQYSVSANVTGIKNMEAQTLSGISLQKIYFQPDVDVGPQSLPAATLHRHRRTRWSRHPEGLLLELGRKPPFGGYDRRTAASLRSDRCETARGSDAALGMLLPLRRKGFRAASHCACM